MSAATVTRPTPEARPALFGQPQEMSDEERAATFKRLVQEWKRATDLSSCALQMANHPAYLRIIGLGPAAIPLVLQELAREPDHWLIALYALTGQEVAQGAVSFSDAVNAWLKWGRANGYC